MLFSRSSANDKIFEIAGRAGYKFVFDKENKQGEFREGGLQYGGSVFYVATQKIKVGLIFDYWKDNFDLYGLFQGNVWTDITVYKVGIAYKYLTVRSSNNKIRLSLGNGVDYYIADLIYHIPSQTLHPEQVVHYRNIGFGFLFELRYGIVNFWTEFSIVRLTGGKKPEYSSVWDNIGVPTFNFHNVTSGIGLSFGL